MGGMEGRNGERNEQQSETAENHNQKGLYLGPFEIKKVRFYFKMLCVYISNCASYLGREHIFRKIMKNWIRKCKMEPK